MRKIIILTLLTILLRVEALGLRANPDQSKLANNHNKDENKTLVEKGISLTGLFQVINNIDSVNASRYHLELSNYQQKVKKSMVEKAANCKKMKRKARKTCELELIEAKKYFVEKSFSAQLNFLSYNNKRIMEDLTRDHEKEVAKLQRSIEARKKRR